MILVKDFAWLSLFRISMASTERGRCEDEPPGPRGERAMVDTREQRLGQIAAGLADTLAHGYLRHMRAVQEAAEKGSARARKGLDDVAPSARVSPGPEAPLHGGTIDES
jgi:hypothetical protein